MLPKAIARWPMWVQIGSALIIGVVFIRVVNFVNIANVIRSEVESIYADRLRADADLLHTLIRQDDQGRWQLQAKWWEDRHSRPESHYVWQVDQGGRVVLRSPVLHGFTLPDLPVDGSARIVNTPAGEMYMLADRRERTPGGPAVTVKMGFAYDEIQAVNRDINDNRAIIYGYSLFLLFPMLGVGLWWAARPVRRMTRDLEAVTSGELRELSGDYPSDLWPLVRTANRLIAITRVTTERTGLQAMAAAHNIRSGLSKINLRIGGLAQSDPDLHRDITAALASVNRALKSHLHTLQMMRSQVQFVTPRIASLELFMDGVFTGAQRLYAWRGLEWHLGAGPDGEVRLDGRELGEMVFNLLDNAGKWAAGRVECRWDIADGWLEITVEDDGPGLLPPDAPLPEGAPRPGLGLGLKIVEDLAKLRRGEVQQGKGRLGGACFILRLPVAAN